MDYVQIVLDQDWGLVGIVPPQHSPPQHSPQHSASQDSESGPESLPVSPHPVSSLSGSSHPVSALRTENPRWDYARDSQPSSFEIPRLADSPGEAIILNPPRTILRPLLPAVSNTRPVITPLPEPDLRPAVTNEHFAPSYPGLGFRTNPRPLRQFGMNESEAAFTPVYGLGTPLLADGNLLYVPGEEMALPNLLTLQHKDNILTGFGR